MDKDYRNTLKDGQGKTAQDLFNQLLDNVLIILQNIKQEKNNEILNDLSIKK